MTLSGRAVFHFSNKAQVFITLSVVILIFICKLYLPFSVEIDFPSEVILSIFLFYVVILFVYIELSSPFCALCPRLYYLFVLNIFLTNFLVYFSLFVSVYEL